MLAKRIIPCLDVKDGKVVKGVHFKSHKIVGDIVELAVRYCKEGADELVFYDITASSEERSVSSEWVNQIARVIDIPFCVAGGIRSVETARAILNRGADKISINSPAVENPQLITQLADRFGQQCVVVGIDSKCVEGRYCVYQYTGNENRTCLTQYDTFEWAERVQALGAGEIVLNCMNQDGVKTGYDITQLCQLRKLLKIPLIASGGAGQMYHFKEVFEQAKVDGALAASVFHNEKIVIKELKSYLKEHHIEVRQ